MPHSAKIRSGAMPQRSIWTSGELPVRGAYAQDYRLHVDAQAVVGVGVTRVVAQAGGPEAPRDAFELVEVRRLQVIEHRQRVRRGLHVVGGVQHLEERLLVGPLRVGVGWIDLAQAVDQLA